MARGYIEIGSGETYDDQILTDFSVLVYDGGKANNTTVNESGSLLIYSGALANNITINSRGGFVIYGEGVASGVQVNPGGYFGMSWTLGKAYDVVENGGYVYIENQLTSGDAQVKFKHNTFRGLVMSSMSATVHSGTIASDTTVGPNSLLQVFSGGTANGVKLNCELDVYGGVVNNVSIDHGGIMHVVSGTANGATVNSGGYLKIHSGGTVTAVVENGGYVYDDEMSIVYVSHTIKDLMLSGVSATVHSGTTAAGVKVNASAYLQILRGGIASGLEINSGGSAVVFSGAAATNTTVNNNGFFGVGSGRNTANNTTVNAGGSCYIAGTANGATVNSDGNFYVNPLGTVKSATVNSDGNLYVSSGGTANDVTVNAHGYLCISSGGTANNVLVDSCGFLRISSGGMAYSVTENGGYVLEDDGVDLTFLPNTFSGVVLSGAYATVHSGTIASNTMIGSDGLLCVYAGGFASGTSVGSGGMLWVFDGALADGVIIGSGAELNVGHGGWLSGRMTFEAGANIISGNYGSLDFDLTQTTAGEAALVNGLSVVQETFHFSLTIDGSLIDGTYNLANGAAGFDQTVWVTNIVDGWLGSLTVGGGTRNFEGHGYTLNLGSDNVLSVTVGDVVPADTKSDIDGNGVSDVMFVWTGEHGEGNYQHGYWMNGTSTWQSAGSNHPAEWENLGCYDMTGDGKADSVLVGNVEVGGVKGAYIGYYADANDLPDGSTWTNIGYLNNADDIAWKNAVGNLTGGAANSIVWYAPELYSLGAWKDGKEDWVSLSGNFGGDAWTLVGCGDFNGDGKDSVVMSYNGGQLFYAVGIDGAPQSLGSSNWSGWEVRAIGDFAGDGKDDLVLFHNDTGSMVMCADGNADDYKAIGQLDAKDWFVVGAGDYNGDQKDDLLVRQYSTGMLGYYTSGDTTQWQVLGYGVGMEWTVIA